MKIAVYIYRISLWAFAIIIITGKWGMEVGMLVVIAVNLFALDVEWYEERHK